MIFRRRSGGETVAEGLDGARLFHALRTNPRTSDLPLILITSHEPDDARIACTELGADDYLRNPFTPGELRARVRTQAELSRTRREATRTARREADDFLAMIGHELRNPLSTLFTMVQAMMIRGGSHELELMNRAVRHLR